ncbi:hypothetical protein M885DRAFT_564125 [Pelagophyceae sp. CCMP2097]|nr:hypothetical protein M885DRAFT_564125 [Pelagophyceae sp. CCMP2097]|mmetsp:Transcript_15199/g.51079  ORF Transcript_15199/g.51079 Transcript_15199/m.51079 type:complete len:221 (+) Transcript_15199:141-803(+)
MDDSEAEAKELEMMIGLMVATGCTRQDAQACVEAAQGSIARAVDLYDGLKRGREPRSGAQSNTSSFQSDDGSVDCGAVTLSAVVDALVGLARDDSAPSGSPDPEAQKMMQSVVEAAVETNTTLDVIVRLFADGFAVSLADASASAPARAYSAGCGTKLRPYDRCNLVFLEDLQARTVPADLKMHVPRDAKLAVDVAVQDYLPRSHREYVAAQSMIDTFGR